MSPNILRSLCALTLLVAITGSAVANASGKPAEIDPAVMTEGFLAAHPDLRWRGAGIEAYGRKDYPLALTYFQRAARYADKVSQAMIAEMYWAGTGVQQDRAIAYAWMDLAAERLYPVFLTFRERYWADLDEVERADAVDRGREVFVEYGDSVAKPRLERVLRRERRRATGSRTGFVGSLTIVPMTGPLAGSGMTLDGTQYFADKYWEPKSYWQLQDEIWEAPIRQGKVEASELQPVRDPAPEADE